MEFSLALSNGVGQLVDFAAIGTTAVSIAKAFEWIEGALSANGKKAISNWLTNLPSDAEVGSWSGAFSHLIDRTFGANPLSIKFILRSCIASCIAVAVVVIIYVRARPIPIGDLADSLPLLGVLSIPNLFVDYLSLLISRGIVQKMASSLTTGRALWLLVVDATLKIIAASGLIFISSALSSMVFNPSHPWHDALETVGGFYGGFPFPFTSGGGLHYGIFFYASFFTSIWVWFYIFGGILIKGLARTGRLWSWLAPSLDLDANPLKAIGRVTGFTTAAFYGLTVGILHVAGGIR